MPVITGFVETISKLVTMHEKKNDDYSGDKGQFFNFEFCEYVSSLFSNARDKVYAVFISVKLARLAVTLSANKVNNESVEDSFDDLITYATIWKCDFMSRTKRSIPNYSKVDEVTVRESTPS